MKRITESAKVNSKNRAVSQVRTAPETTGKPSVITPPAIKFSGYVPSLERTIDRPVKMHTGGQAGLYEWSNVKALHFLCETLTFHAAAIRKAALAHCDNGDDLIDLAEALVTARQVARQTAWHGGIADPEATCKESSESPFCAVELPGLMRRDRLPKTSEVLAVTASSLQPFFKVISERVIMTMDDPERAFELAEALALAEVVMDRDGMETEISKIADAFPNMIHEKPPTFLARQAKELKLRLLMSAA